MWISKDGYYQCVACGKVSLTLKDHEQHLLNNHNNNLKLFCSWIDYKNKYEVGGYKFCVYVDNRKEK